MRDQGDDTTSHSAGDAWSSWDDAPDAPDALDALDALDEDADTDAHTVSAARSEVIFDPGSASSGVERDESAGCDALDAPFAELLRSLRALPGPCAPPIGEGAFDILYASAREIVVWFVPAKDGVAQKEVAIPTRLARAAWETMLRGEPVDEAALRAIAAGAAGGRWLLALFAQLPTVEVHHAQTGADAASEAVTLRWRGATAS
ncbi:MAG TPA: hypothetical protein VF812_05295 [Ktedonobacterales bacterium]